jgi:ATP-dependent DNA ligase
MYALSVQKLLEGKEWLYEVKLDGYRALAAKNSHGVSIWSRRGNVFTAQFPRIAKACEELESDTLLDGEIVAVDETGRILFNSFISAHRRAPSDSMRLTC